MLLIDGDGYAIDPTDPLADLDHLDEDPSGDLPVETELDHHLEPIPDFLKD